MYLIVGYVDSLNVYEVLGTSITWELFEFVYGKSSGEEVYWTSGGTTGQLGDICLNMSGYIFGRWLSKKFPCRINNCRKSLMQGYVITVLLVVASGYLKVANFSQRNFVEI